MIITIKVAIHAPRRKINSTHSRLNTVVMLWAYGVVGGTLQLSVLGKKLFFQDSHSSLKNLIPVHSSPRCDHPVEKGFDIRGGIWSLIPSSRGNNDRGAYLPKAECSIYRGCKGHLAGL